MAERDADLEELLKELGPGYRTEPKGSNRYYLHTPSGAVVQLWFGEWELVVKSSTQLIRYAYGAAWTDTNEKTFHAIAHFADKDWPSKAVGYIRRAEALWMDGYAKRVQANLHVFERKVERVKRQFGRLVNRYAEAEVRVDVFNENEVKVSACAKLGEGVTLRLSGGPWSLDGQGPMSVTIGGDLGEEILGKVEAILADYDG